MKRTRVRDGRSDRKFTNEIINITVDPSKVWRSSPAVIKTGKYERFVDQLAADLGSPPDQYCDHFKRITNFTPFEGKWATNKYTLKSASPMLFGKSNINSSFWMRFPLSSIPLYAASERLKLHHKAAEAVKPTFRGETNLINFLYELKDMRGLLSLTTDILSFVRGLSRWNLSETQTIQAVYQAFFNDTKKDPSVLDRLANAHLCYAFGIKPLISDLVSLYDQATTINKKVEHLQAHSGQLCCSHYQKWLTSKDGDVTVSYPSVGNSDFSLKLESWIKQRYNCTLRYSYKMPDLSKNSAALAATLDTLGLNFGATTVWNMIPFSFVVDWLVDTESVLRPYDFDWTNWSFQIYSGVWSIKTRTIDRGYIKSDTNGGGYQVYWDAETTSYKRDKIGYYGLSALNDPEILFPSFKSLGINQTLLALSLGKSLLSD